MENREEVKRNLFQSRVKEKRKMIQESSWPKLRCGDRGFAKYELPITKDMPRLIKDGYITEIRDFDACIIQKNNGSKTKRHNSQLKPAEEREC